MAGDIDIVPITDDLVPSIADVATADRLPPHHHPAWLRILAASGEDASGLVALRNGRPIDWVLYSLRQGPFGRVATSVPFIAYGGATGRDTPATTEALALALREEVRRRGADVLTVGLSPFATPEARELYRRALGVSHDYESFAQVHELAGHPAASLPAKRRSAIRSSVRKCLERGLRIVTTVSRDQFNDWLEIYRRRYAELGAVPMPDAFHLAIYEVGRPAGLAEIWGILDGDVMAGAIIFLRSATFVDYFSAAFRPEYREMSPNTFLLNHAFDVFVPAGVERFNWESSPGREGVYQFKSHWGANERSQYYLCVLLNAESALLGATPAAIRTAYPYRFVLPFSALHPQPATVPSPSESR